MFRFGYTGHQRATLFHISICVVASTALFILGIFDGVKRHPGKGHRDYSEVLCYMVRIPSTSRFVLSDCKIERGLAYLLDCLISERFFSRKVGIVARMSDRETLAMKAITMCANC
jgi:hypothetical protein